MAAVIVLYRDRYSNREVSKPLVALHPYCRSPHLAEPDDYATHSLRSHLAVLQMRCLRFSGQSHVDHSPKRQAYLKLHNDKDKGDVQNGARLSKHTLNT